MKKRVLCVVSLLCLVMGMSAQDLYERKWNVVHVDRPGNLIPCIFETIHARADNLEIHGEINGSDLLMLNLIMGGRSGIGRVAESWDSPKFFLCPREIDLSDAHFRSGDWYGYFKDGFYRPHWLYCEEGVAGSRLFCGVDSLRRLVLPDDTRAVRMQLFFPWWGNDNRYLEELVVPASVEYFNIYQDFAVRRIVFKGTVPPMCTYREEDEFEDGMTEDIPITEAYYAENKWLKIHLENVTLVVPQGCREKYKQTSIWRMAKEIIEEGEATDVKAAEADKAACALQADDRTFRLDGRLARESDKGVVVRGGRKVLR